MLAITLRTSVARELAQVLAVGGRMQRQQFVERDVALVDQPRAPRFDPVQRGGFAMRLRAIVLERGADRFDLGIVEVAQLLGQKLRRALARDLRRDDTRPHDFIAQVVGERHARKLGIAQRSERLGELEYVERVAAQLAPARRTVVFG